MTHLPYHGDANAAAQDLLASFRPTRAEELALMLTISTKEPDRTFWRDVATLLRLESQDDDPGPRVAE